jgi:2-oxoglutarate dehydrogenase complex dehydrogenase (E1) component-like enzyme
MVGNALSRVPDNIVVHKKRITDLKNKQAMFASGKNFDWYVVLSTERTAGVLRHF